MTSGPVETLSLVGDRAVASRAASRSAPRAEGRGWDVATVGVALAVYGGYAALTWFFHDLPVWIAAPLCAIWLTWHGSLQHETIHEHPTPSRRLNMWFAGPPLSLWIPYRIYRVTHLQHHRHRGSRLTELPHDPESFYLPPGTLARSGRLRRAAYLVNCTLAGRFVLGPAVAVFRFWRAEAGKAIAGDPLRRSIWLRHALGVAMVLVWTVGVCRIQVLVYVMCIVYPSIAMTHLRSFAEHRADPEPSRRTTAVEANPVWALIFLNNNLHIAHHAHPKLPWHALPRVWRQMRVAAVGSGLVFRGGYRQVIAEYLLRPAISIEHPGNHAGTD
jgi:fatty acid desaturase